MRLDVSGVADELWLKMPYAQQAFFDTDLGIQNARKFCIPGTRVQILADIEAWAMSRNPFIATGYWISGMAGTGKSTIAMTVCQALKKKEVLAGFFFCSRQIPECRDYRLIIPTLSYQLAKFSGEFAKALGKALASDPDLTTKKPDEQVKHLLVEPWSAVSGILKRKECFPIFILDALDECQAISNVLEPLVEMIKGGHLKGLKFLFTSWPEQDINERMRNTVSNVPAVLEVKEFILHQVEESFVQADIKLFIEQELGNIVPTRQQVDSLTSMSGKLFIYAATVVKFIKGGKAPIKRQQERLVKSLSLGNKNEDLKA